MRAFVALPLPETVTDVLEAVQAELGTGRPVPAQNMHVTLAFLDDQPAPILAELNMRLEEVVAGPIELTIRGVDVLGGRHPRLIYAGVERTAALTALREAVRHAARRAGIDLPRERFRPHVTLARFPRHLPVEAAMRLGRVLEEQGALRLDPVYVDRFTLYRSTLRSDGAVHEVLADYTLG